MYRHQPNIQITKEKQKWCPMAQEFYSDYAFSWKPCEVVLQINRQLRDIKNCDENYQPDFYGIIFDHIPNKIFIKQ